MEAEPQMCSERRCDGGRDADDLLTLNRPNLVRVHITIELIHGHIAGAKQLGGRRSGGG
jgi:hypothetical protein